MFLTEEMLNKVFMITIDLAPMEKEGPSAKRIKVELCGDTVKNACYTLVW